MICIRGILKPPQQGPLKLNVGVYRVYFNARVSFTCKEMVVVDFGGSRRTSSSM